MPFDWLIELSEKYAKKEPDSRILRGITVFRRDRVSDLEAFIYEPVVCLILQGAKVTSIGGQVADLKAGDALLVSHDLPVVSKITRASLEAPYLALILSLDMALVRGLYELVGDEVAPSDDARSITVGLTDPAWLDPLGRYLALMDRPLDARVLGTSLLREIHYRLLLSSIGGRLRNLLAVDSHASRIAKAIAQMRRGFRSPLAVADLAQTAGMSPSSFHDHFRSVTGTTPLQYVKELRLMAACRLLLEEGCSVSAAAYSVGYESPTHFSRDYSRKFGRPPSRDAGDIAAAARPLQTMVA